MKDATSLGTSNTTAFMAAVEAIIIHEGDFFDNGTVNVHDLREGGERISVSVNLDRAKRRPHLRRSQLRLDVEMTTETIEFVTIDGRLIPDHALEKDADFAEATAKVKAAADTILKRNLAARRDRAIREEWADTDSRDGQRQHELDELSVEFDSGLGNPQRRFNRREAIRELGRLAANFNSRNPAR